MNIWSRFPTRTHCGLRIKMIDFYLPWKLWQEFYASDSSKPKFAKTEKARSIHWRNISASSLQNSSDLKFRVTRTTHLLWEWPWRFLNTVTILIFFLLSSIYISGGASQRLNPLAQPKHFLQYFLLLISSFPKLCYSWMRFSYLRDLLFDVWIPFHDFILHNS